jgi:hypothetical protein
MVVKIDLKPMIIFFTQKTSFAVSGGFLNYIPALAYRTAVTGFFLKYFPLLDPFVRI